MKDLVSESKISDVCQRWKLLNILFSKSLDVNDKATHTFNSSMKAKMY
jgi:hypothetical protein